MVVVYLVCCLSNMLALSLAILFLEKLTLANFLDFWNVTPMTDLIAFSLKLLNHFKFTLEHTTIECRKRQPGTPPPSHQVTVHHNKTYLRSSSVSWGNLWNAHFWSDGPILLPFSFSTFNFDANFINFLLKVWSWLFERSKTSICFIGWNISGRSDRIWLFDMMSVFIIWLFWKKFRGISRRRLLDRSR